MPSTNQELVLEVTLREAGGYRLRAFEGFPIDLATAMPVKGFEDVDFPLAEWVSGDHATIEALKPLLAGRPRVRLCLDPSPWELNRLPFEEIFDRRFGLTLVRHPLTTTGHLAAPYAEEVSVLGKLKVLLVYANPTPGAKDPNHLPHLREHFDVLVQALGGLVRQQLVVLDRLDNESGELSAECILERVKSFDPHVIVYVGHGYAVSRFDRDGLFWGQRAEQHLPFGTLREALNETAIPSGDKRSAALRLLVLIACHSEKAGRHLQSPAFREAEGIRQVQLPVLVGMHHEFPVAATAAFGELLLGGLSRRQSIEGAFAAALRSLRTATDPALKQAGVLPRLWLTARHSRLFPPPEECARGVYLEKVKGAFSQVPFSNRVVTVPLKDLYVERVLVDRKESNRQRATRPVAQVAETISHLAREAADRPEKAVELSTALKQHRRVLLLAEARTGKSTLCHRLAVNCDRETGWLPVLLRFPDFARSGSGLREFLGREYVSSLGLEKLTILTGIGTQVADVAFGDWLFQEWEAGNALLMVDGLDEEYSDERRIRALERVPLADEKEKQPRVVFTSRPFATVLVQDAYVLDLKEFETDAKVRLCAGNCERLVAQLTGQSPNDQRVTAFMQSLDEDQRRKHLARRPGHLVEMYVQFCETGVTAVFADEMMDWVAQERLKVEGRAEPPVKPSASLRRAILEELCFHLLLCRSRSWANEAELIALTGEILSPAEAQDNPLARDALGTQMLADLTRNSGFLRQRRVGGRDAYEVEDASWLQYFAATYLGRCVRDNEHGWKPWVLCGQEWQCPRGNHGALPPLATYVSDPVWEPLLLLLASAVGTESGEAMLLGAFALLPDDEHHRRLTLLLKCLARCRHHHAAYTDAVIRMLRAARFWDRQRQGLRELGKAREPSNLDAIFNECVLLIGGPPASIHESAIQALGWLGDLRGAKPLLELLERDLHPRILTEAEDALVDIGDSAIELLVSTLRHENPRLRSGAAAVLGGIGDVAKEEPIGLKGKVRRARPSDNPCDPRIVASLARSLSDDDYIVRYHAANALWCCFDKRAIPALVNRLGDENQLVREIVAEALGELADCRAVAPLIALLGDEESSVRRAAALALGNIGEREAVLPLIEALKDQKIAGDAARALGAMREAVAVRPIIEALKEIPFFDRIAAISALGEIGSVDAVPTLIQYQRGKWWWDLSNAAAQALDVIARMNGLRICANGQVEAVANGQAACFVREECPAR